MEQLVWAVAFVVLGWIACRAWSYTVRRQCERDERILDAGYEKDCNGGFSKPKARGY